MSSRRNRGNRIVWLFDLDNTLHDAGAYVFGELHVSMGAYVQRELGLEPAEADELRRRYWLRYGATLLGLVRHHGIKPAHFLAETHRLPDLEARISGHRHDLAALRRLRGKRIVLTNAPRAYAERVLACLGLQRAFDALVAIEDMAMFGALRPKPDARMLRRLAAQLKTTPSRCVLVEDTLAHQRSARRIGMRTVWMQRYARRALVQPGRPERWSRHPAYVDRRIRSLRALLEEPPLRSR